MTTHFRIYAYLRASTKEQDATRAKNSLIQFAGSFNLTVATFFIENKSGAALDRPELFRLLDIAQPHDIILVEQIDRISRLNNQDWNKLKAIIKSKELKIVSLDLPTSHQFIAHMHNDEFTNRMFAAINDMMLDMLAAIANKDYTDRRRRQAEGIAKAISKKMFTGRKEDLELHRNVRLLLSENKSYSIIMSLLKCSRFTIAKVAKRMKDEV